MSDGSTPKAKRRKIVAEVAARHNVEVADIMGTSHAGHIAAARLEAYFRIKSELTSQSFPSIGKFFNRHHTTILHGVRVVAACKRLGKEWPVVMPTARFSEEKATKKRARKAEPVVSEPKPMTKKVIDIEARIMRAEKRDADLRRAIQETKDRERTRAAKKAEALRKAAKSSLIIPPRWHRARDIEQLNADRINAFWRAKGKEANAVVVWHDNKVKIETNFKSAEAIST